MNRIDIAWARARPRAPTRTFVAATLALSAAIPAFAQDSEFGVTAGIKAWRTEWTGFTYAGPANNLLTPTATQSKWVAIPSLSVRWGSALASVSAYTPTEHQITATEVNRRYELDANLGWQAMPGLVFSLGYKKVSQRGEYRYEPAGPIVGLSASAPVSGTLGLYGNLGFGWLKTPAPKSRQDVEFRTGYQVGEVGLSWALPVERFVSSMHLTAGYRTQVLTSRDAGIGSQSGLDARDLTQGFVVGLTARF